MTRRAVGRPLAVALLAGAVLAATAVPAHADVTAEGLWYFDALKVQDAHDAGFTGEGVTIAVLDSPINPDIPTLQGADLRVDETPRCFVDGRPDPVISTDVRAIHGTNVVSMILGSGADGGVKGVAPDATVLYYAVAGPEDASGFAACLDEAGQETFVSMADAVDDAVDAGADIVSISMGFFGDLVVSQAVARGLAQGVIFVTGLSNQENGAASLENFVWSTRMNGGVSVQAFDSSGRIPTHENLLGELEPNRDEYVDVAAPGVDVLTLGSSEGDWSQHVLRSGTSFATPIVSGFLAVVAQKYPEATSNQILQSMIHNTGGSDGVASYDPDGRVGYGFVSLTNMLAADPAQYPDENPLLTSDGDPSPEMIQMAADELAAPETPEPEEPAGPGPIGGLLVVLAVVGALVVAGVIVLVVVLAARRRTRP